MLRNLYEFLAELVSAALAHTCPCGTPASHR